MWSCKSTSGRLYFPELDVEAWDGELLNSEFLNGENMSLSHGKACLVQIRRKAQGRMIVMRPV